MKVNELYPGKLCCCSFNCFDKVICRHDITKTNHPKVKYKSENPSCLNRLLNK